MLRRKLKFYLIAIISISLIIFSANYAGYIHVVNVGKKLVCIVLTTEKNFHTRGLAVWNTYGKKCDKILFSCNCLNFARNKNYTDIPFLQLNLTEDYAKMDIKVIQTLNETYKIYNKNYYWFLLVDDDTYVFVDNANRFISKIDQYLPQTFGHNFKVIVKGGYQSGGGGVLFTPESMRRIVKSILENKCNDPVKMGDIATGICSERSNVSMGNSLDESGRERFHPLNMKNIYQGPKDWLHTYSSNNVKYGKECCSEQSITFHYTKPHEMIEYSKLKDESNLTVLFDKLHC
jgi:glycoprotein-N-acetylgalactosamine 3-beta-galactosyltransferase